jgi:hypothetical protein
MSLCLALLCGAAFTLAGCAMSGYGKKGSMMQPAGGEQVQYDGSVIAQPKK